MALNPKRQAFCREYLKDSNGTQAAIRAGYSPRTANEQAAQLLAKLSVKEYLAELRAEIAAKVDVTREQLIEKMYDIVTDPTSTKTEKVRAASLVADMIGAKREVAPNQEREQALMKAMSKEDRALAALAARLRTEDEARKGIKLVREA